MIGMNLRQLRKNHKYTQEDIAEKIGVSRQAVAKWENGETVPDINNCTALAELYGVMLDDLVHHSDDKEQMGVRPKGKHIFGLVKVGERGQIVIPKKKPEKFSASVPGTNCCCWATKRRELRLSKTRCSCNLHRIYFRRRSAGRKMNDCDPNQELNKEISRQNGCGRSQPYDTKRRAFFIARGERGRQNNYDQDADMS